MKMRQGSPLRVSMTFGPDRRFMVGRLALERGISVLEYDPAFIASGLSLNPLLETPARGLITPRAPRDFDGLPGFIADSLPDAWGELLIKRRAALADVAYPSLTALDKLAIVGKRAMGALTYEPAAFDEGGADALDLDALASQALEIVEGHASYMLPLLERLGGSSGGARPKVLIALDEARNVIADGAGEIPPGFDAWLVKFRSSRHDFEDVGPLEAAYADMARAAGLEVAETRVFSGSGTYGYFGTKRFDRVNGERLHVLTTSGMLDTRWDVPTIDYDDLMKVARRVVGSHDAAERIFQRMVFNVVAHNRDDHAKQHAFIMNERGDWETAPTYDLTYSRGPGGEHYLAIGGRAGDDITLKSVTTLGRKHGISMSRCTEIVKRTLDAVSDFKRFSEPYGLSRKTFAEVDEALKADLQRLGARTIQGA